MIKYLLVAVSLSMNSCVMAQEAPAIGTVYWSKDKGATWQRSDRGIPPDAVINRIAEKGARVILATENYGIYASDDQMQTWHASNHGLPVKKIDALQPFEGSVFAGSFRRGIFRSGDDGTTWQAYSEGLTNFTIRAFFTFHNMLLAGTNDGAFVLQGDKWKQLNRGLQINDFSQIDDKLFVATNRGMMVSSGPLTIWKTIFDDWAVHTFSRTGGSIIAITYFSEMIKVDDEGHTWPEGYAGFPRPVIYAMISIDDYILMQTEGGLFRSFDSGNTWQKIGPIGEEDIHLKTIKLTKFGLVAGVGAGRRGGR